MVEAEELEGQLYAELEGLPKYGKQFASAIRCILKRENRWACLLLADMMQQRHCWTMKPQCTACRPWFCECTGQHVSMPSRSSELLPSLCWLRN